MKARSETSIKLRTMPSPARNARRLRQVEPAPGDRPCPREQMIAEAAYYRAERRGFAPGNEMDDWLEAEADIGFVPGKTR